MIDLGLQKYMKQDFRAGEKVTLIHMNETAIVTRVANGMIYVNLDGDEIPVYPEDITLIANGSRPVERREFRPREEQRPKEKVPISLLVLKEKGLLLIMEPFIDQENKPALQVYIQNGFQFAVHYNIILDFSDGINFSHSGLLAPKTKKQLFPFQEDKLNDKPNIYLSAWQQKGDENEIELRIRPTAHFKKKRKFETFPDEVYVYEIFNEWPGRKSEIERHHISKEELEALMKANKVLNYDNADLKTGGIEEIDLHASSLGINEKILASGEILEKQLSAFKRVLERAIQNKRERLVVIHGYGKGKLKNEVCNILDSDYSFLPYRNEYHHRYGHGATFIDL